MRAKRIWVVIALILVVGISTTTYTKHYVTGQELSSLGMAAPASETRLPETTAEETGAALRSRRTLEQAPVLSETPGAKTEAAAADGEAVSQDGDEPESQLQDSGAETGTETEMPVPAAAAAQPAPEAGDVPEPAAAPQTPAVGPGAQSAGLQAQAEEETQRSRVVAAGAAKSRRERLEELDIRIEKNRSADADGTSNYQAKARAESELKLWETELDGILETLEDILGEEAWQELQADQREWKIQRELRALDAARNQNATALESVEYTASLTADTRARAYELVDLYADKLD